MIIMLPTLISRLFEPVLMLTLVTITGALISGMIGVQLLRFIAVVFFGIALPPVVLLIWALKRKFVSNWDISIRKERIVPFIILLILNLWNLLLVRIFGNPFLVQLFIVLSIWFVGFLGITLFWKISGHTGTAALVTGLFIRWFGWGIWPVLLVVPLLAWARVAGKKHTPAQVVAGAVYSFTVVIISSVFI